LPNTCLDIVTEVLVARRFEAQIGLIPDASSLGHETNNRRGASLVLLASLFAPFVQKPQRATGQNLLVRCSNWNPFDELEKCKNAANSCNFSRED